MRAPAPPLPPEMGLSKGSDFLPVLTINEAVNRYNQMVQFVQEVMVDGKDFGKIPGVDKPSLLKPGAEKLCNFFGLAPTFEEVRCTEKWDGEEPFFFYRYRCSLWRGDRLIGSGIGSANSHESKHRYRWARAEDVPAYLNKDKLKSRDGRRTVFEPDFALNKKETTGQYGKPAEYWASFEAAIQAKTANRVRGKQMGKKTFDGWEIQTGETQYRIPNPDAADIVNTLDKMAQKRALVAAALIACNASDYFTQDIEDLNIIEGSFTVIPDPPPPPAPEPEQKKTETKKADPEQKKPKPAAAAAPAPAAAAQPAHEPAPFNVKAPEPGPDVMKLWALMGTTMTSILQVFSMLKKEVVLVTGSEAPYYEILKNHGWNHANEVKIHGVQKARLVARDIYEATQRWKEAAEPPAETIPEDDFPVEDEPSGAPSDPNW